METESAATTVDRPENDNVVDDATILTRSNNAAAQPPPFQSSAWQKIATKSSFWEAAVDESRLLYPDITTGKVNRLFSTLEYTTRMDVDDDSNNNTTLVATHAAGSVVGAAALVAGTTVGAGVLALPAATATVGFLPSSAALIAAYVFMTLSGLLIAEKTLNQIVRTGRPGLGLLDLYRSTLGTGGTIVGTAAYFFLHYAMMVAYLAQGGHNVQAIFGGTALADGTIPPQVIFAAVIGGTLLWMKPTVVEQVNNVMVLAVGVTFLGIVGIGAQSADWSALVEPAAQHPDAIVSCLPILFLALVYQNIVPTVVNNLEGDRTKITQAIVGGTTAPLLMFLAWNAVCLGNVGGVDTTTAGLDPVALLQSGTSSAGSSAALAPLVTAFSVLALITSLIGFTYGLVDAWTDIFGINQKSEAFGRLRPALYALVYLPPLALSMTDPGIFLTALEYGGAFGVSTLFLALPPLMVWKERYENVDEPLITKPMVGLGKLPLTAMGLVAGTLIVEQAAEKTGVLDALSSPL